MSNQMVNPIIKSILARGTGAFHTAKTHKNPRNALQCPNGPYYAQIKQGRLTEIGKAGTKKNPAVEFRCVIVCHAGDDQLAQGDMSYAGEQPRALFTFGESAKRTEEGAWESFMYSLQDLGYDTSYLIVDESERTNQDEYTLESVLEDIGKVQPFVKISISDSVDQQYRNTNIRGLIAAEELKALIGQDPNAVVASAPQAEVPGDYDYGQEAVPTGQATDDTPQLDEHGGYWDAAGNYIDANGVVYPPDNSAGGQAQYQDVPDQAAPFEAPAPEPVAPAAPPQRQAPQMQRPAAAAPARQAPPQQTAPAASKPAPRPAQTAPVNPAPQMQRPPAKPAPAAAAPTGPAVRRPAPPPPRR